jgi:polysaccharide biosynthesis/export protein
MIALQVRRRIGYPMRSAGKGTFGILLGIVALVAVSRSAAAQDQGDGDPSTRETTSSGYVIGPADVLRIVVWKEPDLTRDVTVRPDGMITVPLLGDVPAAGRAPNQVAESLAEALKRYIESPQVVVIVSQATSARFYVLGRVTRSGEYPLTGGTTVLQGLALAGGFQEYAKMKDIVVVKGDGTVVPFNFDRIADGKDVSQNLPLDPGDTIVVP